MTNNEKHLAFVVLLALAAYMAVMVVMMWNYLG
jgi:hypothetical protein